MVLKKRNQKKVFCIGLNKTGTTTIERIFQQYNLKVGDQSEAEFLVDVWYKRDFDPIINYCKKYEAFQDAPFSLPFTFIILDRFFPDSKFILTVRDTPSQWYSSLISFHSKLWSNGTDAPTTEELKAAEYRYKGYAYEVNRALFNSLEDDPYNRDILIDYYNNHIALAQEYFRSHPKKLIVINVSVRNDYFRLCEFLEKPAFGDDFPWENKTN